MKTILVTGANGFIGSALIKSLCHHGYTVRATVRSASAMTYMYAYRAKFSLENLFIHNIGELSDKTDWHVVLDQVDTVIHCAARAHIIHEDSINPLETFRQINQRATTHLAQRACESGVRRFIFLSSIGVLGNSTGLTPFTDTSIPNPQAPYAQAKWEAEQSLLALPSTMERVIIRSPLVYGPGMKGNFGRLLNLINKRIPMPLGAVKNKRQFIGINNLIDFIMTCVKTTAVLNETFIISDKEVLSTTQLLQYLANSVDKPVLLVPIPHSWLTWGLTVLGQEKLAEQLLGNMEIKANKARELLGWEPIYSMQEQLSVF